MIWSCCPLIVVWESDAACWPLSSGKHAEPAAAKSRWKCRRTTQQPAAPTNRPASAKDSTAQPPAARCTIGRRSKQSQSPSSAMIGYIENEIATSRLGVVEGNHTDNQ